MKWTNICQYRSLMADSVRMDRYREAIRRVCAEKIICEIGVGLGPLSLMALQAGAKRVYGIELGRDVLEFTTKIARDHGFDASRFIPLPGLSTEIELPERVDVILSETLDSMGVGENTAVYMRDARTRFLKPDGAFLPARLNCYVAIANPKAYEDDCRFWNKDLSAYGLNYRQVNQLARAQRFTLDVLPEETLSEWYCWQKIDFARPEVSEPKTLVLLLAEKPGLATGISYAFQVDFAEGIVIDTRSGNPSTHWKQGFSPFPHDDIAVERGDLVCVELAVHHADPLAARVDTKILHIPAAKVHSFLRAQRAGHSGGA